MSTKKHAGGPAPARTRAEKKELARLHREAAQRRARRARFIRTYITVAVLSMVAVAVVFLVTHQ